MTSQRGKVQVVVDGSNMATEGRSDPSLAQLDEVLRAFRAENPRAELIVVADATFAHRVAASERSRFHERESEGTIVTPPAGAIGRGDAFILKIADRITGVVLSNDSFQEFHHLYPWLFDEGRLIGGKPVPGVGWIFTPRLPVRGAKSVRAAKKAALAAAPPTPAEPVPAAPARRTSRRRSPEPPVEAVPSAPRSQRREHGAVNDERAFAALVAAVPVGAEVDGTVRSFTSHGAVVDVRVNGADVECYAPTALLGDPAPARAREVLTRGEVRRFRLISVDPVRRIGEVGLP